MIVHLIKNLCILQEVSSLNSDLDVVQKYLKQTRPDGEYNEEIIATYLSCNGLLSEANQCLQVSKTRS